MADQAGEDARGAGGAWRSQRVDWRREQPPCCELCGRPLRGRLWVADGRVFCDPGCERLHHEYRPAGR